MADELGIVDISGLTYSCEMFVGQTLVATITPLTEVVDGNSSRYYGTVPVDTAAGIYDIFYIQDSTIEAVEQREWNGTSFVKLNDIGSTVWTNPERTLTAVQSVSSSGNLGNRLEIYNHTTYTNTWSGLTIPADWKEIYFTAKLDPALEADAHSTILIKVSRVVAVDDGLVYLNGGTSTLVGTLTIDQGSGTVKLDLSKALCAELLMGCSLYYDVKMVNDDDTDQFLISPSLITIKSPVKR